MPTVDPESPQARDMVLVYDESGEIPIRYEVPANAEWLHGWPGHDPTKPGGPAVQLCDWLAAWSRSHASPDRVVDAAPST